MTEIPCRMVLLPLPDKQAFMEAPVEWNDKHNVGTVLGVSIDADLEEGITQVEAECQYDQCYETLYNLHVGTPGRVTICETTEVNWNAEWWKDAEVLAEAERAIRLHAWEQALLDAVKEFSPQATEEAA